MHIADEGGMYMNFRRTPHVSPQEGQLTELGSVALPRCASTLTTE